MALSVALAISNGSLCARVTTKATRNSGTSTAGLIVRSRLMTATNSSGKAEMVASTTLLISVPPGLIRCTGSSHQDQNQATQASQPMVRKARTSRSKLLSANVSVPRRRSRRPLPNPITGPIAVIRLIRPPESAARSARKSLVDCTRVSGERHAVPGSCTRADRADLEILDIFRIPAYPGRASPGPGYMNTGIRKLGKSLARFAGRRGDSSRSRSRRERTSEEINRQITLHGKKLSPPVPYLGRLYPVVRAGQGGRITLIARPGSSFLKASAISPPRDSRWPCEHDRRLSQTAAARWSPGTSRHSQRRRGKGSREIFVRLTNYEHAYRASPARRTAKVRPDGADSACYTGCLRGTAPDRAAQSSQQADVIRDG